jgi:hypothetical protein
MRSLGSNAPVGTRSAQRLSEVHVSTPVIRESPRPLPYGLGGTAW